jgi:hypothetical protein
MGAPLLIRWVPALGLIVVFMVLVLGLFTLAVLFLFVTGPYLRWAFIYPYPCPWAGTGLFYWV